MVVFEPGSIGIGVNSASGVVTEVDPGSQADRLGVKAGWQFYMLEDTTYSESQLPALVAGNRNYSVTFKTKVSSQRVVSARQSPYRPPSCAAAAELPQAQALQVGATSRAAAAATVSQLARSFPCFERPVAEAPNDNALGRANVSAQSRRPPPLQKRPDDITSGSQSRDNFSHRMVSFRSL